MAVRFRPARRDGPAAATAGIRVSDLSFTPPGATHTTLREVSLELAPGEFVAVLGHNGSGKSTLARHLNGLIAPQSGSVLVDELDASRPSDRPALRRRVGLIFQNSEHQIVGASVAEDVYWGIGSELERDEATRRMLDALHAVGLDGYENQATWRLSGGQKQRLALAGVLVRGPRYLVCDEPTALLDGRSREEARELLLGCRDRGLGLLWITHRLDEALLADRLLVLESGAVAATGTPAAVLAGRPELAAAVPPLAELAARLRRAGVTVQELPRGADDLAGEVAAALAASTDDAVTRNEVQR
jgi:energy-coupling factor transporter ATP-binding protein EcfA2